MRPLAANQIANIPTHRQYPTDPCEDRMEESGENTRFTSHVIGSAMARAVRRWSLAALGIPARPASLHCQTFDFHLGPPFLFSEMTIALMTVSLHRLEVIGIGSSLSTHAPSRRRLAKPSGRPARRILLCAASTLYGTRNQVNET